MAFNHFFDSVLREIEFGRIDQGLSLLVGMLDAVLMQGASLTGAREALVRHVLHQMMLEEPIYAHAGRKSGDYAGLVSMASRSPADERISPTGRRLFEATRNLPFIRALRQRQTTGHKRLERAWKDGLRICLLGNGGSSGYTALSNRDESNVANIDIKAEDWPNLAATAGMQFDLIGLPDVADTLVAGELFSLVEQLRPLVSPAGSAILSVLRPGHLGSGWREACLNWRPNMHGEESLQRAASAAGFSAHIYSDESDCIIWAELRPESFSTVGGGRNDED
jgi:hypothetical protein